MKWELFERLGLVQIHHGHRAEIAKSSKEIKSSFSLIESLSENNNIIIAKTFG